ncbi:MAG: hypothetical protein D6744_00560 [Planctomycetota bacterium]|nr:MAG: hypothetical protein D6744_00560 [Planctomycetota bacterium]
MPARRLRIGRLDLSAQHLDDRAEHAEVLLAQRCELFVGGEHQFKLGLRGLIARQAGQRFERLRRRSIREVEQLIQVHARQRVAAALRAPTDDQLAADFLSQPCQPARESAVYPVAPAYVDDHRRALPGRRQVVAHELIGRRARALRGAATHADIERIAGRTDRDFGAIGAHRRPPRLEFATTSEYQLGYPWSRTARSAASDRRRPTTGAQRRVVAPRRRPAVEKTVAIVGASADRRKYGNISLRAHVQDGWTVYPVNPHETEIEGLRVYRSLDDVPRPLKRVSLYVPPEVGVTLIPQIVAAEPEEFFVNPGAESPELMNAAVAAGLEPLLACSIIAIGMRPDEVR